MENKRNILPEDVDVPSKAQQPIPTAKSFDPKNYLNLKLEDDEMEKTLKIRLLTVSKDDNHPFHRIKMHNVPVPKTIASKGFKSYICLKETEGPFNETMGRKCPFCETNQDAYQKFLSATDDVEKDRWKKISLSMKSYDVDIFRCIERGAEEDGPKFCKCNVRQDGVDIANQIRTIFTNRKRESIETFLEDNDISLSKDKIDEICELRSNKAIRAKLLEFGRMKYSNFEVPEDFEVENIFDRYNGKDLMLTVKRVLDSGGKDTGKTSVKVSDYGKNKPISKDDAQADAWYDDEKEWSDVFAAKPYEYLDLILQKKEPYFDKKNKKWSTKEEIFKKRDTDEKQADEKIAEAEKKMAETQSSVDDDELPY